MKKFQRILILLLAFSLLMCSACSSTKKKSIAEKETEFETLPEIIDDTRDTLPPVPMTDAATTVHTIPEATVEVTKAEAAKTETAKTEASKTIKEDGSYTTKDDVALYIHTYGKLPSNFISKAEAEKLGWTGGSLEKYAPGKCIGGSYFGNYEKLLPTAKNRTYTECDIDTLGKSSRGSKRIVFSNDGLIYYTGDHYQSFELLYGSP